MFFVVSFVWSYNPAHAAGGDFVDASSEDRKVSVF